MPNSPEIIGLWSHSLGKVGSFRLVQRLRSKRSADSGALLFWLVRQVQQLTKLIERWRLHLMMLLHLLPRKRKMLIDRSKPRQVDSCVVRLELGNDLRFVSTRRGTGFCGGDWFLSLFPHSCRISLVVLHSRIGLMLDTYWAYIPTFYLCTHTYFYSLLY